MKRVVVIADRSNRIAVACVRGLRGGDYEVYLASSDRSRKKLVGRLVGTMVDSRRHLSYNSATEEAFIASLLSIRNHIGSYFLMPSGQQLMSWAARHRQELIRAGVEMRLPTLDAYEAVSDKYEFIKLCNESHISCPSILSEIPHDKSRKFVVKPLGLTGDPDVLDAPFIVSDPRSRAALEQRRIAWNKHFAQEYVEGPSYYYCAAYSAGCRVAWFCQHNVLQQPGGKSVIHAVPADIPGSVVDKVDHLMARLSWDGVMMFEFKRCLETDCWYAIECNPRLWGPIQLALDNGVNFPRILIEGSLEVESERKYIGYRWLGGYIQGLIHWLEYGSSYQRHSLYKEYTVCRSVDVWLRRDTAHIMIAEAVVVTASVVWALFLKITRRH